MILSNIFFGSTEKIDKLVLVRYAHLQWRFFAYAYKFSVSDWTEYSYDYRLIYSGVIVNWIMIGLGLKLVVGERMIPHGMCDF